VEHATLQPGRPAPSIRSVLSGPIGAVACGCALAGTALLVAVHDPSAPGSRFPACTFHQLTGLWCPGCGMTRATHDLLHGDVAGALGSNLFTPFVLLAIVATWWAWSRRSFGLAPGRVASGLVWVQERMSARWGAAMVVTMVLYAVLRNVPVAPFEALAP
jgi:hypothetical protein